MPKIVRISLLLLCAWVFLNLAPTLICGSLWRQPSFHAFITFYSWDAWFHPNVWVNWRPRGIDAFLLPLCCITLLFTLALWLRKPNIFRASLLIAIGPFVIPIRLGLTIPIFAFASVITLVAGFLLQGWWDNRNRPAPEPSAPMPTWHH